MTENLTRRLPDAADVIAPDGLEVRVLAGGLRGSMAEFRLGPGRTGRAVRHRTVEEIWFVLEGQGEMWREGLDPGAVALNAGQSVTVPVGRAFQVRNTGDVVLRAVAVTMPPWPMDRVEAEPAEGPWTPDP